MTQIEYTATATDSSPTTTPKLLATLGTFNKLSATSQVAITWNSDASGAGTGVCRFMIRVDNAGSTAGDVGSVVTTDSANHGLSVMRLFNGLAAGSHAVQIWSSGVSATSCADNPLTNSSFAVVMEN
jgi:hypothetical protein